LENWSRLRRDEKLEIEFNQEIAKIMAVSAYKEINKNLFKGINQEN
jgi:hypothetical protein